MSAPQVRTFGRFQVHRTLGEGGMGVEYLAFDAPLNRWVILKVPRFNNCSSQVIERFQREAQLVSHINHPHIGTIHDIGQVNGVHYLTMPYIRGESLARRIHPAQPWRPHEASELVHKLTTALGALHARGVIHRDLNPSCVLIRTDGEPVLVDFGLARLPTKPGKPHTSNGPPSGTDQNQPTPAYLSPEQANQAIHPDQANPLTASVDIYALGVIFYQLLTGQLPFSSRTVVTPQAGGDDGARVRATNRAQLLASILQGNPRPPSELNPALGQGEDALVLRALARDPAERYPSMAEFGQALQEYTQHSSNDQWNLPILEQTVAPDEGIQLPPTVPRPTDVESRMPVGATPVDKESRGSSGAITTHPSDNSVPARRKEEPVQDSSGPGQLAKVLLAGAVVAVAAFLFLGSAGAVWWAIASWKPQTTRSGGQGGGGKNPKPSPGLVLSITPEITVEAGGQATILVQVERTQIRGPVELDFIGLPRGVQASPLLIRTNANETQVTLSAADSVSPGKHTLRVRALTADIQTEERLTLTIASGIHPKLTLGTIRPVELQAGGTRLVFVPVKREHFTEKIDLQLDNLPRGVTAQNAYVRAGSTIALVRLKADRSVPMGEHQIRVQAEASVNVAPGSQTGGLTGGHRRPPRAGPGLPEGRSAESPRSKRVTAESTFALTVKPWALPRYVYNSVNMKLVLVPAGKFLMGTSSTEQKALVKQLKEKATPPWLKAESPQHSVEITRAFYIGAYEVTQDQYQKVMGTNPSFFSAKGDGSDRVKGTDTRRYPVESVSWEDARDFCKKLSALPGERLFRRVYRLPTEAEWEFACRGGASSSFFATRFHFGNSLTSTQATFKNQTTTPVGRHRPNKLGLYDMHGNVYEWCYDRYSDNYYARSPTRDPTGPTTGTKRVLRGGSWYQPSVKGRAAARTADSPRNRYGFYGFRVVLISTR